MRRLIVFVLALSLFKSFAFGQSRTTTTLDSLNASVVNNTRTCARTGTNAGAKIAAAIATLPGSGGTVDCTNLEGNQTITSTLTIPGKVTVRLGAASFNLSGSPGICIAVGSAGNSGALIGIGAQTTLNYLGAGHAVEASGSMG